MHKTRGMRRHHAARVKNNRRSYWNIGDGSVRSKGVIAQTPCLCSCYMCGNPRRYGGYISKQEYKAHLFYCEDMIESDVYNKNCQKKFKS